MQLKRLRTLHLRQTFVEPVESPHELGDVRVTIHCFAASFYKHLQKESACPDLEDLVVRMES
jgi:hypothetical protein